MNLCSAALTNITCHTSARTHSRAHTPSNPNTTIIMALTPTPIPNADSCYIHDYRPNLAYRRYRTKLPTCLPFGRTCVFWRAVADIFV